MKNQAIKCVELYVTVLAKIVGALFMIGALLSLALILLLIIKAECAHKLLFSAIMLGGAVLSGGVGYVVFRHFPAFFHNKLHALFQTIDTGTRT